MTQLYTREMWGALPLGSVTRFSNPELIFVHHTTGVSLGADLSDDWCRNIDRQHKYANGWAGIGYSWLFDNYGNIFEGRGWEIGGAHTYGYNARSHAFAFMGNGDIQPSEAALEAVGFLIVEHDNRYGQKQVKGHRDVSSTHCPGNWLYGDLDQLRGGTFTAPTTPGTVLAPPSKGIAEDGAFGPQTVRALQASLNETGANPKLATDGIYGPATKRALQGRLNHVAGPVAIDGVIGPNTVRALQRHIGASVDGQWGPETTRRLQVALNAKTF